MANKRRAGNGFTGQQLVVGLLSGVLLTAAAAGAEAVPRHAVGWCQVAQKDLENGLAPSHIAADYIHKYQRGNPTFNSTDPSDFGHGAKVTLLSRPKLGKIKQTERSWLYTATKLKRDGTYVGRDHFVMKVENKGVAIVVHYFVEVIGNEPTTYIDSDGERRGYEFCKRHFWKISQTWQSDDSNLLASPPGLLAW